MDVQVLELRDGSPENVVVLCRAFRAPVLIDSGYHSASWVGDVAHGSGARNSALHLAFRCQVFSLFDHEAHGFFLLVRRVLVLG